MTRPVGRGPGAAGGERWRPSIVGSAEGAGWSSREDQARAARLDREIDAQNLWGPVSGAGGGGGAGRDWAGRLVQPSGVSELDDISGALAVATGLRLLIDGIPDAPEDGLGALRAATSAFHSRGPWRAIPPAGRFAVSGVGAVAAAVIGAVAWSGVTNSNAGGFRDANLVSAVSQLHQAGIQLSQANQALADGNPVKAKLLLAQAQVNTADAAAQLPSPAPQPSIAGSQPGSLAAALVAAQNTIASLQNTVASYQAAASDTTTTSVGSQMSSTTATSAGSLRIVPSGNLAPVSGSNVPGTCDTTTTIAGVPSTVLGSTVTTLPGTTTTTVLPPPSKTVPGGTQTTSTTAGSTSSTTEPSGSASVSPPGTPNGTAPTSTSTTSTSTTTTSTTLRSVTPSTTCTGSLGIISVTGTGPTSGAS